MSPVDWAGFKDQLADYILALVARLRAGEFPIASQKKDCPQFCDFRSICRVSEVRMVGKVWNDRPALQAVRP